MDFNRILKKNYMTVVTKVHDDHHFMTKILCGDLKKKLNNEFRTNKIISVMEQEVDFIKVGVKNENIGTALKYSTDKHAGSIVESIIRRQGHNISKLARHMKISRCTLYNWFEHDTLPFDILVRIGSYIDYDFSSDFPEIFRLSPHTRLEKEPVQNQFTENEKVDYWMMKYILLLEKYNECLISHNNIQESK